MSLKRKWEEFCTLRNLQSYAKKTNVESHRLTINRFLQARQVFLITLESIRSVKFDDGYSLYCMALKTKEDGNTDTVKFLKQVAVSEHNSQMEYAEPIQGIKMIPIFRQAAANLAFALEDFKEDLHGVKELALSVTPTTGEIIEDCMKGNKNNFKNQMMIDSGRLPPQPA